VRNWFCNGRLPCFTYFQDCSDNSACTNDLKEEKLNFGGEGVEFDEFKEMIGFNAWSKLKELFSSND
jgi:hypothetical protein